MNKSNKPKSNFDAAKCCLAHVGADEMQKAVEMMAQARLAPESRGKTCFLKLMSGAKMGLVEMIHAKCFECAGYYWDGRHDCGIHTCALYSRMPYGKNRKKYIRPDRMPVENEEI